MPMCALRRTFTPGAQQQLGHTHERRVEVSKARLPSPHRKTAVRLYTGRMHGLERNFTVELSNSILSSAARCGQALGMVYAHLIKTKLVGLTPLRNLCFTFGYS